VADRRAIVKKWMGTTGKLAILPLAELAHGPSIYYSLTSGMTNLLVLPEIHDYQCT